MDAALTLMITCTFENNNKISLRHITVNAIVVKNNQILLVIMEIVWNYIKNI